MYEPKLSEITSILYPLEHCTYQLYPCVFAISMCLWSNNCMHIENWENGSAFDNFYIVPAPYLPKDRGK